MKFINLPEEKPITPTNITLKKKVVINDLVTLEKLQYLDKKNYLDEFNTSEEKQKVRDVLGITDIINKLPTSEIILQLELLISELLTKILTLGGIGVKYDSNDFTISNLILETNGNISNQILTLDSNIKYTILNYE